MYYRAWLTVEEENVIAHWNCVNSEVEQLELSGLSKVKEPNIGSENERREYIERKADMNT
jgi:hypothetical protein